MLSLFKKRDHAATVNPGDHRLLVRGGEKLLNAALEAGLDWPHDCRVGSCGTCRCYLKAGRIKPLTDFVYTLAPEDIAAGAILACQARLMSDVVVEVELGAARHVAIARRGGRITDVRDLTRDIRAITVKLDGGALEGARAGQYADITTRSITAPRSYSFAHAPELQTRGTASFFIRHVPGGAFTDWLFAADRTGTEVELAGPYGSFFYRPASGRMICVAGGSGLAPIHALLEACVHDAVARDCVVLFGARTQADLYYLDELAALGRAWRGRFELVPVLSEEPPDSGWRGARGLVTEHVAAIAGAAFDAGDQGYVCGPPAMVDAAIERLIELGVHDEAIFCDRFLDASTQPGGRAALA